MPQSLQTIESEVVSTLPLDAEAQQAEALVEEMPPVEITATSATLTTLLQEELRQKRRSDYALIGWVAAFSFLGVALFQSTAATPEASVNQIKVFVAFMVGMGMLLVAHIASRAYPRRSRLTQELTLPQKVAGIGPLVEMLGVESTSVRNQAKRSLIPLLPTLQASDAALLTEAHRNRLLRILAISPNATGHRDLSELFSRSAQRRETAFQVSILKAFEQVGGTKELPLVERLAQGKLGIPQHPAEVIQAAQECLPYLQERASEQRASSQLLRASSGEATPHGLLLRPAQERGETLPEQLLRASENGSD